MSTAPKPLVAIVGRPNVGKSTLFNRLAGRRIAITEDTPGITRDRLYTDGDWRGRDYTLIDTGGIQMFDPDPLKAQIRTQAEIAMSEADVIVLVVDTTVGLTADDFELANALRRSPKPLVVLANKVDNGDQEHKNVPEVYALGFPEVYPVSSLGGRGVADALDAIVDHFPPAPDGAAEEDDDERVKIAIIGRPNVGKSSLLNAILGEERAIVSPVAGTTRDSVDTMFEYKGNEIVLVDTAGIRRAGKIQGSVEYYTVLRALRAIERADVVMLVIDSIDGLTDGDKRVGGYAHEAGRAGVIVVNKWDAGRTEILEDAPGKNPMKIFSDELRDQMPFMAYAPLAFTSAVTGKGVFAAVDAALDAAENHAMRIPTGELNRLLRDATDAHPYNEKGKALKIYYATMPTVKPPQIVLFVNDPDLMHFSYKRYLENRIRETYSFEGDSPENRRAEGGGQGKMTEIARLPFQSSKVPEEQGTLVLHDDGTFRVEPSAEFRDTLAGRETRALALTEVYGTRLGVGLLALGAAAVAAGWYLGRAYGSLARNLIAARPVRDVHLTQDAQGGLRLRMPGAEHRWQKVAQEWRAGDFDAPDAERFLQTYKEMRG